MKSTLRSRRLLGKAIDDSFLSRIESTDYLNTLWAVITELKEKLGELGTIDNTCIESEVYIEVFWAVIKEKLKAKDTRRVLGKAIGALGKAIAFLSRIESTVYMEVFWASDYGLEGGFWESTGQGH